MKASWIGWLSAPRPWPSGRAGGNMSNKGADAGMSDDGKSGNSAKRSAPANAVLFDRQYAWPGDLTEIPDWVYTDENIYRREIERIFHGRTWNYVALEAEVPNAGDFIRSNVGPKIGRA